MTPVVCITGPGRAVTQWRRCLALGLVALALVASSGCATYSDRLRNAHADVAAGNYGAGIAQLNSELGVDEAEELPQRLSGDKPLAALERSVLLQARQQWSASARDLSTAEAELELLDISPSAIGALGSYIYSDSASSYRTPPTERLCVNAVNLLNYLGNGDVEGAAVEARRFQVMREFLDTKGGRPAAPDALGAYLAGFVFEKKGEGDRALRYYDEALSTGRLDSLVAPVQRLASINPYRGKNLSALASGRAPAALTAASGRGEILIVVASGRVPYKVPARIPVGAAVGLAGVYISGDTDVLRYGASKVLVYPELTDAPSRLGVPRATVDGKAVETELLADLGDAVQTEYEQMKPKILAAALSRMVARAAASEGVRVAGNSESQALGDLLSILFEATLVALDKPDTRSWTMLPARVSVARVPVAAGSHEVSVSLGYGVERRSRVDVPAGGWAAVVVTEPR